MRPHSQGRPRWIPLSLLAGVAAAVLATAAIASSSAGGPDSVVEQAKKATAAAEKAPTSVGLTARLKSAPTKGNTVVYVACNSSPSCTQIGQGFAEAATAVHWKIKTLTWNASQPASLVAALQTALRYKPVAVYFAGVGAYAQYASVVPAYTRAGVKILQLGVFDDAPHIPTLIRPGTESNYSSVLDGRALGNAFVATTNGEGSALLVTVTGISVVKPVQDGIESAIARCSSCHLTTLTATVDDFIGNKITPLVIAAIRKDPDIKYVITTFSGFITGLHSQLEAIGRGDVKVLGNLWDATAIAGIRSGTDLAWTSGPYTYIGWQGMDQILRNWEKMPIPASDGVPVQQLITASNVSTIKNTSQYIPPFDYRAQFKKLWRVG